VVCRQVANERVAQARQRFAGHLVEVVDNLDSSCVSDSQWRGGEPYLSLQCSRRKQLCAGFDIVRF
jgi:hypothetical protein